MTAQQSVTVMLTYTDSKSEWITQMQSVLCLQ